MSRKQFRVDPEKLRRQCDPASFAFDTTADLTGVKDIVGQARVVRAMEFGLNIQRTGYNIFMVGLSGTGRTTYARKAVQQRSQKRPVPADWCYVYNFANPSQPQALSLPGGKGREFKHDIEELEAALREEIPKAFDGDEYEQQKNVIVQHFQKQRATLLENLTEKARSKGFSLKTTNSGFVTVPIVDEREVAQEDYAKLDPDQQREIEERSQQLRMEASEIMRRINQEERQAREKIRELDYNFGLSAVGHFIEDLQKKYADFPRIVSYLTDFKENVLDNLDEFKGSESEEQTPLALLKLQKPNDRRYQVNLVVDNSETQGAPVVEETNPTWYNLLGRVEYQNEMGSFVTDFTKIKAGAFHRANGGYLIIQAMDLLTNPLSWQALKRVLKNQEISVESIADQYSSLALSTLRPEPIPLTVKVILIGNPHLYHLLYNHDEDFRKLFKVKVDFNDDMNRTADNEEQLAQFVASQCEREYLLHFRREAVARVVEYSSRLAAHQDRLSTHFNELGELLYEADAWARKEEAEYVKPEHVDRAVAEKRYRSNRYQEFRQRLVAEGKLFISTKGEAVGQINGLSVLATGDFQFGVPSRITANTFAGRGGITNIEREIQLSGHIHSKGVLTLAGYLGQRFAQNRPLSLSASITFEQLYSGVEGDSASSAELFALISSLSGVPISQALAVTGSVNQKGEIQPVGGINEKIEGFYATCKLLGLSGTQGVIIPRANISDLMLDNEVLDAVKAGNFHVYAIGTVEEGLEILTGLDAGAADNRGEYPQNSIFGRVAETLQRFAANQTKKQEKDE